MQNIQKIETWIILGTMSAEKKDFWYVHLLKQSQLLLDNRFSFFLIHGSVKSANNYAKFFAAWMCEDMPNKSTQHI